MSQRVLAQRFKSLADTTRRQARLAVHFPVRGDVMQSSFPFKNDVRHIID